VAGNVREASWMEPVACCKDAGGFEAEARWNLSYRFRLTTVLSITERGQGWRQGGLGLMQCSCEKHSGGL
jgi:hypothetical protein